MGKTAVIIVNIFLKNSNNKLLLLISSLLLLYKIIIVHSFNLKHQKYANRTNIHMF